MSRLAYLATALAHVKADDYTGVQRIRVMLSRVQRPSNCSRLMGQNEVAPTPYLSGATQQVEKRPDLIKSEQFPGQRPNVTGGGRQRT